MNNRNKQSQVYNEILQLKTMAQNFDKHVDRTIDALRHAVLEDLEQVRSQKIEAKMDEVSNSIQQATISQADGISTKLNDLTNSITRLQAEIKNTRSLQRVLESLYYERFRVRQDQIPEAHVRTFDWIFEGSIPGLDSSMPIKFLDWLENGNGIFWVRGKAGSGKSTLMKFLCTDPRTAQHLQIWSGDKKLVLGKYFFWSAGTPLQKSREGLLRSLLFDILSEWPELNAQVEKKVGTRLKATTVSDGVWGLQVLRKVCDDILSKDLSAKFCLFIDGLDEYDGFSEDLIEDIRNISSCPDVKVCVSSRPWTEFVDAFSDDPDSLIRLEDLTSRDIATYVHDRLFNNTRFNKLAKRDHAVSELEIEIVRKSQGVFLWVYLVVRSLLEGAKYADSIHFLRKRLTSFPPDLEDFFQHMLSGVPSIYREKTAKIFKYAMAAPYSMPVLVYHFLEKIEDNQTFALEAGRPRMKIDEVRPMLDDMESRLDGWTKGLLEIVKTTPVTVEFLHRTVRDFIHSSTQVQRMFNETLNADFHVSEAICHGLLAFIMYRPSPPKLLQMTDHWPLDMFYHARIVSDELGTSYSVHPFLDQLRNAVLGNTARSTEDICHLAVQFGLVDYVAEKLMTLQNEWDRKEDYLQRLCTELLRSTLQFPDMNTSRHSIRLQYKPSMIMHLINRGADPNNGPEQAPIWVLALDNLEVLNILIGAVPSLKLSVNRKKAVENKLKKLLPHDQVEELLREPQSLET